MNRQEYKKYYSLYRATMKTDDYVANKYRQRFINAWDSFCWEDVDIQEFIKEYYPKIARVFHSQSHINLHADRYSVKNIHNHRYMEEFKRLKRCESMGIPVRSNLFCWVDF